MARRFRRFREEDPRRGQREQSETILREKKKAPVRRLDPDQQAATVQVVDPLTDDIVGLGELRLTGSPVTAVYDPVDKRVTLDVAPKLDANFDFGQGAQSFPNLGGPLVLARDGATVEVVNEAAFVSLFSFVIPGGLMNANSCLRLMVMGDYLNNTGGVQHFDIRLRFGGDTLWTQPLNNTTFSTDRVPVLFETWIGNRNSLSSQFSMTRTIMGRLPSAGSGLGNLAGNLQGGGVGGTNWHINATSDATMGTLDTSVDQLLEFQWAHNGVADANLSVRKQNAVLELL